MPRLVHRPRHREVVFVQHLTDAVSVETLDRQTQGGTQLAFMNAYSFSAARRDMYIHDADFRLPM